MLAPLAPQGRRGSVGLAAAAQQPMRVPQKVPRLAVAPPRHLPLNQHLRGDQGEMCHPAMAALKKQGVMKVRRNPLL